MFEAFIDFIDSLYWDGYAERLAEENPQAYTFELNQFFENHN